MKNIFKKVIESILIGIIFLYVYNFICGWFNINFIIPINIITICLIGFLRLPGFILVILILFL